MISNNYFRSLLYLGLIHEIILHPKVGQTKNLTISLSLLSIIAAECLFNVDLKQGHLFVDALIITPPELLFLYITLSNFTPAFAENLTISLFTMKLFLDYYGLISQTILSTPENQIELLFSKKHLATVCFDSFFNIFMMEHLKKIGLRNIKILDSLDVKKISLEISYMETLKSLAFKEILKNMIINYQNRNFDYISFSNEHFPLEKRKNLLFLKMADYCLLRKAELIEYSILYQNRLKKISGF